MKYFLGLILTLLSITATATDLQSVGGGSAHGLEAVLADYYYFTRDAGFSQQQYLGGLQYNAGSAGSVGFEVGDTQLINKGRINYATAKVRYSNGLNWTYFGMKVGIDYTVLTGDGWIGGRQHEPTHGRVGESFETTYGRRSNTFVPYLGYTHSYFFYPNGRPGVNGNGAAVGSYVNFSKKVGAKIGFTHVWDNSASSNYNRGTFSLIYKF